jgi:hypothetical protein
MDVVLGDVCGGSNSPARYALWCAWVYLIGVDTIHVDLFDNCNTDVLVLQFPLPGLRAHVALQSLCKLCVCFVNLGSVVIALLVRDRCAVWMLSVISCKMLTVLVCMR